MPEYFKNVLNRDRVKRKDIEKNGKVYDTSDVMEDLRGRTSDSTKWIKYHAAPVLIPW
jgi:hypothetical protein